MGLKKAYESLFSGNAKISENSDGNLQIGDNLSLQGGFNPRIISDTGLRIDTGQGSGRSDETIFIRENGSIETPGDLRLGTGQAIEDEGNTKRLNLLSSETTLKDDSGDSLLSVGSGFGQFFRVYSGQEFVISDEVLGAGAIKYKPDPFTGTLEMTNSVLDMQGNKLFNQTNLGTSEIDTETYQSVNEDTWLELPIGTRGVYLVFIVNTGNNRVKALWAVSRGGGATAGNVIELASTGAYQSQTVYVRWQAGKNPEWKHSSNGSLDDEDWHVTVLGGF